MSDIIRINYSLFKPLSIFIFFNMIILAISCDGNSSRSDNPEVYDLVAPDSLIKNLPDTTAIFISARDPQGLEDIDSVFFTVTRPDNTSNDYVFCMFDDGENGGDSIAGDGIYTQGIQSPSSDNQTGDYVFHFSAKDKSNNSSNTIDKVITAYVYDNPVVRTIIVNQYDNQRQHLFVSARVLDAQSQLNIDSVWVEITYLDTEIIIGAFALNDFGNDGDSVVLDTYYSRDIAPTTDSIFIAGSYHLQFKAIDYDNNFAVPIDTTIVINQPTFMNF